MTLETFKPIYWVEFFHRQMGMALGYVFMIPLVGFWYKGFLNRKMKIRMAMLLGLGGIQGGVGWWMVRSGLKEKAEYQSRPRVSPYRLATHLGLATTLYSGLVWSAFSLLIPATKIDPSDTASLKYHRNLRLLGIILVKCLILNILTGAFVAGIDAGRVYNTWPLMNGQVVPSGLTEKTPLWKNFFENMAMVQFNHRNMAYITCSVSWYLFYRIMRAKIGGPATVAGLVAVAIINYQAVSGILTLLGMVPPERANGHQMTAMLTLTAVLLLCYLAKVPPPLPL
jgi:heme a synthase